jgi:hypothetical protein
VVHQERKETIGSSVAFLLAYHRGTSEEMRQPLDRKGKQLAVADSVSGATSEAKARWIPPPVGWIKLNTEGSLRALRENCNTGDACAIARNSKGEVLIAACKPLVKHSRRS